MGESVRVHFRLEQDADGYPPVAVETLWAKVGERPDECVVVNIPFFVRSATVGDTVKVTIDDGQLWFSETLHHSKNSLVRVILFEEDAREAITDRLVGLGCDVEYLGAYKMLAVNVPKTTPVALVQTYLREVGSSGAIDYEEAIIWD